MVATAKWKEAKHFKTGKTFRFKVNFITLTLPAPQRNIGDREIKKHCLDAWLKRAKRKYGLKSYIWRAERQKNGNLHFHIITDCYIRYDFIRNDWNSVLSQYHFIEEFKQAYGHHNPNSTDVHSVKNVKNLSAYFVKYFSKSEVGKNGFAKAPLKEVKHICHDSDFTSAKYFHIENPNQEFIDGKIWDCSSNLKTRENCEFMMDGKVREIAEHALQDTQVETKNLDFCTLIFLKDEKWDKYVTGEIREGWEKYLDKIRNAEHPEESVPVG